MMARYYQSFKRVLFPLLLFLFVLRQHIEVAIKARGPNDVILYKCITVIATVAFGLVAIEELTKKKEKQQEDGEKILSSKQFIFLVLMIAYVLALKYIGFLIATFLFLYTSLYYLKYANWKLRLLIPFCFTFSIYIIFAVFLNLRLPTGILW